MPAARLQPAGCRRPRHALRGALPGPFITDRLGLDDAPEAYRMFRDKRGACVKVVLGP